MKQLSIIFSLVLTNLLCYSQQLLPTTQTTYGKDTITLNCGAVHKDKCPSVISNDTVLLADETTLTWGKTEAKIHCSNESVFNDLFKTHGTLFKRFTCTWKTDRHGRYKDYTIYLAKEDAQLIVNWAKTNL